MPIGNFTLALEEKVSVAGVVKVPPEIVIPVNVPVVNVPAAAAVPPIAGGEANKDVTPAPDIVPDAVTFAAVKVPDDVKLVNVPAAAELPPIVVPSIVPPLISALVTEREARSVITLTTFVASLNTSVVLPVGTATPVPELFLTVTVSASPLLII